MDLNKNWKERMEDAAGILSEYEAARTLLQMNGRSVDSRTANHLEELIAKNNQTFVPPKVRASFPIESLQHIVGQTCVPPKVQASFPIESLQHLVGQASFPIESLQHLVGQTCVPPKLQASFPIESLQHLVGEFSSCLKKELTISDTKQNQMRLMFPKGFVEKDINPLLKDGESPKRGIPITLYFMHPKAEQYRYFHMLYKSWGEDKTYVLTSGWLTFVKECNINVGDNIELWAFRHSDTGNLCFAVTLSLQDGR